MKQNIPFPTQKYQVLTAFSVDCCMTSAHLFQCVFKSVASSMILLVVMLGTSLVGVAATKTWNGGSGTTLSWNVPANWSPNGVPLVNDDIIFNTAGTLTFTTLPGSNMTYNSLTIIQGAVALTGTNRNFALGGNTGVDFSVASGATLTITNVNITLATNATASIAGTLIISASRTFNTNGTSVVTTVTGSIINSGTVTCATATKLLFQGSAIYQHAVNGGTIPSATWNSNSNCNITGVTTTVPGGLGQNFGNFTWNCTNQTSALVIGGMGTRTIKSFNLLSTGTNTISYVSTIPYALTVTDYLQSGGIINFSTGTQTFTLNISGNFNHTGGTINETSSGAGSIVFNGTYNGTTGMQTYTSGGTVSNSINFTVNNGAYLQMAAIGTTVTGGGLFTLQNGATLGITSADGITANSCGTGAACGNIRTTTRTFNTGADYIYNGNSAQNTGNGLPATVSNLTFDNSSGAVTFNSARNITDNFTIASGSVANLDAFTHTTGDLTLGVEGTVSGSWGSSSSTATYKNDTFFAPTTGILNVTNSKCGVVTAPTGISASPANICVGESSTIAINNPGVGFTTDWFTGSCGGILVGTGNSLSVSPSVTTTYHARIRNTTTGCFSVSCANVTVTVIPPVPDFDATITDATCPSSSEGSIEITNSIPIQFNDPDYIEIGSNLLSNRNGFTLEGWIKVDLNDIGIRISLFGQNDAIEFGFMSSTSLTCWTASGGSVSANNIYPTDNGWHHVAAVGNGSNIILYIDGVQVATGGNVTGNYGNNTSYSSKIGAEVWDPIGGYFPGQMLKVGFWNTALSATQISNLAADYFQYTGSETGLIAGYNFFEGTGTTLSSETAGTDGNFNGTPTWTDIYTYSWTKTGDAGYSASTKNISTLTTGEYNLTVTNGTCTRAKSFTVSSTLPVFTSGAIATTGETICNGGNPAVIGSSIASSGGDNSITYEWRANGTPIASSNSATFDPASGLTTSTTYTRWAKDGTCNTTFTQSTGSWVVTVNPLLTASISSPDDPICSGDDAIFTLTGTSEATVTYSLDGGTTTDTKVLTSGTASVTITDATVNQTLTLVSVTDGTCSQSLSGTSTVTVNPLPITGSFN